MPNTKRKIVDLTEDCNPVPTKTPKKGECDGCERDLFSQSELHLHTCTLSQAPGSPPPKPKATPKRGYLESSTSYADRLHNLQVERFLKDAEEAGNVFNSYTDSPGQYKPTRSLKFAEEKVLYAIVGVRKVQTQYGVRLVFEFKKELGHGNTSSDTEEFWGTPLFNSHFAQYNKEDSTYGPFNTKLPNQVCFTNLKKAPYGFALGFEGEEPPKTSD